MQSNTNWQLLTSQNSGLPGDRVADIVEDASGALWFAVYGGGLARRSPDGRQWQTYRAGGSPLVNDYVGALVVDAAGRVWAVCDARQVGEEKLPGAICTLSPDGAWQVYPRAADEDCIVCIEADRRGVLWLRTGGLYVGERLTQCDGAREGTERFHAAHWLAFDGSTWTPYEGDRAALAAWYPQRPSRTRLGWELVGDTLWLLETVQPAPLDFQGLGSLFPSSGLTPMPMGLIPGMGSFACEYNLVAYDGQEFRMVANLPSPFRFGELVVDTRGHHWISLIMLGDIVMGSGLGRFDGTTWTQFNKENGLLYDYIASLTADSRGNVWCAHMLGDLSAWDGQRWIHLPGGEEGRPKEDLGRATEDRQGRLWFPSKAGVLVYTP
jgi:hypothetical protein